MKVRQLFFILFFLLSCKSKSTHIDFLEKAIKAEMNIKTDSIKYLIVVPSGGCSGCISEGINFIKDNIEVLNKHRSELRIVFTAVTSLKTLKNNVGESVLNSSISYIDHNNSYFTPCNESIYPVVLYLKNKTVNSFHYKSPQSPSSFDDLLVKLQNEKN